MMNDAAMKNPNMGIPEASVESVLYLSSEVEADASLPVVTGELIQEEDHSDSHNASEEPNRTTAPLGNAETRHFRRTSSSDPPGSHAVEDLLAVNTHLSGTTNFTSSSPWQRASAGAQPVRADPPGSFSDWQEETKDQTAFRMPSKDPFGVSGYYTGPISDTSRLPHGLGRFDYVTSSASDPLERRPFYNGEWNDGKWEGQGHLLKADGETYSGHFQENRKHGHGKLSFSTGDVFDGEFENDKMLRGELKSVDGSIYMGQFSNGLKHGQGRQVLADGSIGHDGEWCHGEPLLVRNGDWVEYRSAQIPTPFDPAVKTTAQLIADAKIRDENGQGLRGSVVTADQQRGYWLGEKIFDTFYGSICEGRLVYKKSRKRLLKSECEEWHVLASMGPVAIKTFSLEQIHSNQDLPEDPEMELAAVSYVHQNVRDEKATTALINALELLQDTDFIYFVTPLYENKLHGIVNEQGQLPEPKARIWFRQIISGISGLQAAKVCHRHISSWDIMIHDDSAVILHFGVALRIPFDENGVRQLIEPMKRCGRFVAPEIERNEAFDGFAVDLFSAGVVLFFMLLGEVPWEKACKSEPRYTKIAVQGQLEEVAKAMRPSISPEAIDLLQIMLCDDPRDRFCLKQIEQHPWLHSFKDIEQNCDDIADERMGSF